MKIGIDFHSAEQSGSGNCTYIRNLIESLIDLEGENEYFLYVTDIAFPYYRRFANRPNIHLRPLAGKDALRRILSLGLMSSRDKIDILHVQYVAPPFFHGKLVVTVHDISYHNNPGYFSWGKRTYLKTLVPYSLKKSHQVITVSDFSKQEIMRTYHIPAGRVHVTKEAAPGRYKPARVTQETRSLLLELGITEKFLLFIGRLDIRKNIPALIEAFSLLRKAKRIPHQLVITGYKDFSPRQLQKVLSAEGLDPHVIFTGLVPEECLPTLYTQAEVFIYPSFYEGFGLPVLEAMASACPVIVSDSSSLPEIVGDAGLLVNPRDVEGLAEAIWKIVSNEPLQERLKRKSLEQSKKFSWLQTAQKTMAVYRRVFNMVP